MNVLIIEYQEQFLAEGPRLIASNEIKSKFVLTNQFFICVLCRLKLNFVHMIEKIFGLFSLSGSLTLKNKNFLLLTKDILGLNMMYRLINRTPNGIQTLLETLSRHIKSEGLNAMKANAETILTVFWLILDCFLLS